MPLLPLLVVILLVLVAQVVSELSTRLGREDGAEVVKATGHGKDRCRQLEL